jgi:hypothetical protein
MNINQIVGQLKAERERLDRAIAALSGTSGSGKTGRKRILSAEARERIAKAQRRRWAKVRAEKGK